MYARVEKSKENKSRAVANLVGQKKSDVKQGFGFVDNRTGITGQGIVRDVYNTRSLTPKAGGGVIQRIKEGYTRKNDYEALLPGSAVVYEGILIGGSSNPGLCVLKSIFARALDCEIGTILIAPWVAGENALYKKAVLWHEYGHKIENQDKDTEDVFTWEMSAVMDASREEQIEYFKKKNRGNYIRKLLGDKGTGSVVSYINDLLGPMEN